MSVACEACRAQTTQSELNLSPAGQWLCRSCFGTYQAAAATRHGRANNAVRRCTCGTIVTPLGEEVNPLNEDGNLELGFFLRRDVYVCSGCANRFAFQHPVGNVILVSVCLYIAQAIWRQNPHEAEADEVRGPLGASILGAFVVAWLARDFYYRWRYRRVY